MYKFLNKIVNGNSLEILKKIPDKTFNLIFADPPYNLQIGKKLKSVAAASIVAKVARDMFMIKLWKKFPKYKWNKNFGYGTVEHLKIL